jgi:hypothetical protein
LIKAITGKTGSQRRSGEIGLIASMNRRCASKSTGRCLIFVLAGNAPRWSPFFQSVFGRIGRGENPPPQFGHTFSKIFSTHSRQNVHSKLQIIASTESGGNGWLQFSHVGLSSSMTDAKMFA